MRNFLTKIKELIIGTFENLEIHVPPLYPAYADSSDAPSVIAPPDDKNEIEDAKKRIKEKYFPNSPNKTKRTPRKKEEKPPKSIKCKKCFVPLKKRQKKYCSRKCQSADFNGHKLGSLNRPKSQLENYNEEKQKKKSLKKVANFEKAAAETMLWPSSTSYLGSADAQRRRIRELSMWWKEE